MHFFVIFAQSIDCGGSNEYNVCFRAKIRKNIYPCIPQFYYIKVGFKVVYDSWTIYPDISLLLSDVAILI